MMANKIIQEIEYVLKESNSKYSGWFIGITNNPARSRNDRRDDGKDVSSWTEWEADDENVARSVEEYFVGKGMNDTGSEGWMPNFVFIF